jgi:hypothetical protein
METHPVDPGLERQRLRRPGRSPRQLRLPGAAPPLWWRGSSRALWRPAGDREIHHPERRRPASSFRAVEAPATARGALRGRLRRPGRLRSWLRPRCPAGMGGRCSGQPGWSSPATTGSSCRLPPRRSAPRIQPGSARRQQRGWIRRLRRGQDREPGLPRSHGRVRRRRRRHRRRGRSHRRPPSRRRPSRRCRWGWSLGRQWGRRRGRRRRWGALAIQPGRDRCRRWSQHRQRHPRQSQDLRRRPRRQPNQHRRQGPRRSQDRDPSWGRGWGQMRRLPRGELSWWGTALGRLGWSGG